MTTTSRFGMRHVVGAFVVLAALAIAVRRGAANAPAGRYTIPIPNDGTVFDTKTGLTWQQGVPATKYSQPNAVLYCTNNTGVLPSPPWRLPSMQELQSIVDESQMSAPAIDQTAFPNTPSEAFWTSTLYKPSAGDAWYVAFGVGAPHNAPAGGTYRVRCVR